jgi:hypothetical protein
LGYIGRVGTRIRTWASLLQSKVIVGRIYKSGVTNCGMGTYATHAAGAVVKAIAVNQGSRFGRTIHDDGRFIAFNFRLAFYCIFLLAESYISR